MTSRTSVTTCLFLASGAEEAANFYVGLIPDSRINTVFRPDPDGPVLVVDITLGGAPYMVMNGNPEPNSSHTVSICVETPDQTETDRLWAALTEGGEENVCGWLKDRYGVHWQIVPEALPRLMMQGGEVTHRVSAALMQMTKIDVAALEAAAKG
jgi:predicted 3-demethylubiquinone-9 3-methyltransferase (glyoxalase superfamily)